MNDQALSQNGLDAKPWLVFDSSGYSIETTQKVAVAIKVDQVVGQIALCDRDSDRRIDVEVVEVVVPKGGTALGA